jgi:uncharacterized protein YceK
VALSVALVVMLVSGCSSQYERTNPIPRICKELEKECR